MPVGSGSTGKVLLARDDAHAMNGGWAVDQMPQHAQPPTWSEAAEPGARQASSCSAVLPARSLRCCTLMPRQAP